MTLTNADIDRRKSEMRASSRLKLRDFRETRDIVALYQDELVYHYTNTSGLTGILTSKCLRATNLSFVNDEQELRYGYLLCANVANDLLKSHGNDQRYSTVLNTFQSTWKGAVDVYATCFARNGDQLSQWRAYSPNSSGFSIGFDAKTLYQRFVLSKTNIRAGSVPVVYEPVYNMP